MVKEPPYVRHQGVDCSMLVISRDVVVQLFPETLDDVVVRRVRRQEVQHDTSTERFKALLDTPGLVDDVGPRQK